jgi:hypothetical protein
MRWGSALVKTSLIPLSGYREYQQAEMRERAAAFRAETERRRSVRA